MVLHLQLAVKENFFLPRCEIGRRYLSMYRHQVLTPCTCNLLPAGRIIVHSGRVRLASDDLTLIIQLAKVVEMDNISLVGIVSSGLVSPCGVATSSPPRPVE
eukprot:scaffold3156_cov268-Chaetoceros_neogracile.AAC.49